MSSDKEDRGPKCGSCGVKATRVLRSGLYRCTACYEGFEWCPLPRGREVMGGPDMPDYDLLYRIRSLGDRLWKRAS